MSEGNEDDPLAGILGDELGEWDKMFDSLHESADTETPEPSPVLDPPTPVVELDVDAIDPPTPAGGEAMDFALAQSVKEPPESLPPASPFDEEGVTLGPPGAAPSEYAGEGEVSFGGVPEALGSLLGSEGHEEYEIELGQRPPESAVAAPGVSDVALADVLGEEVNAEQELARISDRANAFFEEGPAETAAFELDDDFYEGIEIGSNAIPTPIPEDEPMESSPYGDGIPQYSGTPSFTSSAVETSAVASSGVLADEKERGTPVRGVVIPDAARGPQGDDASDPTIPKPLSLQESDGIPQAIGQAGHGALRTGATRPDSEDSVELASEVDGALESIRSGPSTPAPLDLDGLVASDVEPGPRIDGVVDAAFDDAVAMSTGTLHTGPLPEVDVEPDLPEGKFSSSLPELSLSQIQVAERVEPDDSDRTEEIARLLVLYERELSTLDEPGATIRIRIESGRLAESLGDLDRARRHLDEALKLDPRLIPANRALRRIERRLGNWDQVLGQLDNEIQKAGAMEARALAAYRTDLLRAAGEPDLARVAVGELLDSAPKDTRALLANLELAFVDGREDEVRTTLAALADSLSGPRLRSVVYEVAGIAAGRDGDREALSETLLKADQAYPNLGAQIARSTMIAEEEAAKMAALALRVGESNAELGAAIAWRAAEGALASGDSEAALTLLTATGETVATHPLLLHCKLRASTDESVKAETWKALALAAEDDLQRAAALGEATQFAHRVASDAALSLAEEALAANPHSSVAQVWVRRLGGSPEEQRDIEDEPLTLVDAFSQARFLQDSGDIAGARAAVTSLLARDETDAPALRLYALELAHASGDLAELSRHYEALAAEAASDEVSKIANRGAARALTRVSVDAAPAVVKELQLQAAEAWRAQALQEPGAAAETARLLAQLSGEESSISDCTAVLMDQVGEGERHAQVVVEDACRNLPSDASGAAEGIATLLHGQANSRALELFWSLALSTDRVSEAAEALEAEAAKEGDSPRADRYRYRAAYARVQNEHDLDIAVDSLSKLVATRPEFGAARELLATALGHGGTRSVPQSGGHLANKSQDTQGKTAQSLPEDEISAAVRRIEALARTGAVSEAADRSADLQTRYPDDALVQHSFSRWAWMAGASADLASQALAELRLAEERNDSDAKTRACETLARIDLELRGDRDSARMFWESASNASPHRADLQRILEAEYRGSDAHLEEQRVIQGRVIASLQGGPERSAYLVARARLSEALECDATTVRSDYEGALQDDALCREALFFLEAEASAAGPTEALANLEFSVAQYFSDDPRARGAFLVRSGETWRSLGKREQCLAMLKAALNVVPGFAPALSAWRDLALDHELWGELAEACLLEAASVDSDAARASLFLLAGVTLMDKVNNVEGATSALRSVLVVDPLSREAFVRLRQLYLAEEADEDLAQLFSMRLDAKPEAEAERCELHLSLARVLRASLKNDAEALAHYRALLVLRPNDKEAVSAVAEISWQQEKWADAAEALMVLARIESDEAELVSIFTRLGTIYAEHLPEPRWALKSFHKVVTLQPGNSEALHRIADLGAQCGEHRLALSACEQLIKQEPPIAQRIEVLIRMAEILRQHADDPKNAERALRHALDLDPGSDHALDALVRFYVEQNDLRSARVHVDRVANAMRKRIRESAVDAEAYRVLARAMAAKASAGAVECMPTAQVAASLALQLGVENAETAALATQTGAGMGTGLAGETFDDLLFPHDSTSSARALFALLGGRLAKHIGIDIRHHGVGRSDRLRKGIDSAAGVVLELAAEMGVEDVDIYVSKQKPKLVAVEPTSPFSLILGTEVANPDRESELRFLVGRSLKGASASLSAPLQLGEEGFGVLLVGLLRQFQPDFAPIGVDSEAASAEQQRLRRLIPSNLLQELQPYALGLATSNFDHRAIWQGMADACNRAGVLCAGDASAAIAGLMRIKGHSDLRKAVQDAEIASLVRFSCSSEHSRLWAAIRA